MSEQIFLTTSAGKILKFDCIAAELYNHLGKTFHTANVLRKEINELPASIAYGFSTLSLIYRFRLLSDEDFKEFQKLLLAEQYTIATRLTFACYELMKLEKTIKEFYRDLDKLLKEELDNKE